MGEFILVFFWVVGVGPRGSIVEGGQLVLLFVFLREFKLGNSPV
jgi:hypothetical protein